LLAKGAGDGAAGQLLVGAVGDGRCVDVLVEGASRSAGVVAGDEHVPLRARRALGSNIAGTCGTWEGTADAGVISSHE
jgi:hypothetical protein